MKIRMQAEKRRKKTKGTMRGGRNHGAVSVFLVGVLVPCLIISSLCIDLSRVVMSKATAEAAADMALNSLLTYYDFDLEDWYGMAASCQNIDEFYEGTANYFLESLKSTDLTEDQISTVYENFMHTFADSDDVQDLLLISSNTDAANMISTVPDANLTNPTIIRNEIVEFMKYRAPIEITSGVLSNLFQESGDGVTASGAVSSLIDNDVDLNVDEVEYKQNFYEAQGEFSKDAYKAYCVLREYEGYNITNNTLKEDLQDINKGYELYKEIHTVIVKQLFNTSGLSVFYRLTSDSLGASTYTMSSGGVSSKWEDVSGTIVYYTTHDIMGSNLSTLQREVTNFEQCLNDLNVKLNSVTDMSIGDGDNQISEIQWWAHADELLSCSEYTSFRNAAVDMVSQYNKVLAIKACVDDGGYEDETIELTDADYDYWENNFEITADRGYDTVADLLDKAYNKWVGSAQTFMDQYLVSYATDNGSTYLKFVDKLETISSNHINDITYSNITLSTGEGIDAALSRQAGELSADQALLENAIEKLDILLNTNKLFGKYTEKRSLYNIKDEADAVGSAYDQWSGEASERDTDMKEQDDDNIKAGNENALRIDGSDIQSLIDRLTNIRAQLHAVKTSLEELKYGSKASEDITSYSIFYGQTDNKVTKSGITACNTNAELEAYINDTFLQLITPDTVSTTLDHESDSAYNPDLSVATPAGYTFLDDLYRGKEGTDISDEESDQDEGKNAASDKESEAKSKGRYKGGCTGGISVDFAGTDKVFGLGSTLINNITNLYSTLSNGNVSVLGDDVRDSLYATVYVMNMFSYATYDYQGRYDLMKSQSDGESKVKALTPSQVLTAGAYDEVNGAADQRGTWLSTSCFDPFNKSLTNKMINSTNNYAYEAELEYILFGQDSCEGNVKEMYTKLFEIRYALNLISGFQHFWSPSSTVTGATFNGLADFIAGSTLGIIPAPVTMVVLIAIITAFETAMDMERLEAGFPVELYKDSSEWWCSFDYGISDASDLPTVTKNSIGELLSDSIFNERTNSDKGLTYRDYIALFLLLGFMENSDTSQQMYQRTAAVMQTNMIKLTGDTSYSLSKSLIYVKFKAELQVEPLMLAIPMFYNSNNVLLQGNDWRTYDIELVRGFF